MKATIQAAENRLDLAWLPRLQVFREDRTLICANDYIAEALGERFVESVPLNMEHAWSESHPKCPLICLLSAGARLSYSTGGICPPCTPL